MVKDVFADWLTNYEQFKGPETELLPTLCINTDSVALSLICV